MRKEIQTTFNAKVEKLEQVYGNFMVFFGLFHGFPILTSEPTVEKLFELASYYERLQLAASGFAQTFKASLEVELYERLINLSNELKGLNIYLLKMAIELADSLLPKGNIEVWICKVIRMEEKILLVFEGKGLFEKDPEDYIWYSDSDKEEITEEDLLMEGNWEELIERLNDEKNPYFLFEEKNLMQAFCEIVSAVSYIASKRKLHIEIMKGKEGVVI